MIELSRLAKILDPERFGKSKVVIALRTLCRIYLGKRLRKDSNRTSDWEAKKLSDGQMIYARDDVRSGLALFYHLKNKFELKDRIEKDIEEGDLDDADFDLIEEELALTQSQNANANTIEEDKENFELEDWNPSQAEMEQMEEEEELHLSQSQSQSQSQAKGQDEDMEYEPEEDEGDENESEYDSEVEDEEPVPSLQEPNQPTASASTSNLNQIQDDSSKVWGTHWEQALKYATQSTSEVKNILTQPKVKDPDSNVQTFTAAEISSKITESTPSYQKTFFRLVTSKPTPSLLTLREEGRTKENPLAQSTICNYVLQAMNEGFDSRFPINEEMKQMLRDVILFRPGGWYWSKYPDAVTSLGFKQSDFIDKDGNRLGSGEASASSSSSTAAIPTPTPAPAANPVKKEAAPKKTAAKKETPVKKAAAPKKTKAAAAEKKPAAPKKSAIKKEPVPKKVAVKKEPATKKTVVKKEPATKKATVKKEPAAKKVAVKKEPATEGEAVVKTEEALKPTQTRGRGRPRKSA